MDNIYSEQMNIVQKTNKRINAMLIQENFKRKIWNKLSTIYGISSTIFIGLVVNYFSNNTINDIALGVSGGLAVSSYFLKKLEFINESMSKTSFIDFKEYIIREEYKRKMQKSINGVIL